MHAKGGFAPLSIDRFGFWPKRCKAVPRYARQEGVSKAQHRRTMHAECNSASIAVAKGQSDAC
jgi:hypothetical protein